MYLTTNKPNRKGLNFNHFERKGEHGLQSTIVRLYDTHVLISDNNQIKLNSGGFKTNHTKNVINDFLPSGYKVFQKDFDWYVTTPDKTIDFKDGITIAVM